MDQRLIALESRLSHHERMAEEMSDMVARQGRQIDSLVAQVRLLKERLADATAEWSKSPQDDKPPPHY